MRKRFRSAAKRDLRLLVVIKRRLVIGGSVVAAVLLVAWHVHRTTRLDANIADLHRGGVPAQDAAEDIAAMGRSARKAVPGLVEVLMRGDWEVPGPESSTRRTPRCAMRRSGFSASLALRPPRQAGER